MSGEIIRKTAALSVGGKGTGSANVCFVNTPDRDRDAFAPGWAEDAKVPGGRAHDLVLGGESPPAFVADIRNRGDRYEAQLKFLDTPRGRAEYETVKALAAEGIAHPVSMAFNETQTIPVPDFLEAQGVKRYIKRGKIIELSLVTVGAIPLAQITSIKQSESPRRSALTYEEQRRIVVEARGKLQPYPVSDAEIRKVQREFEAKHAAWICDTAVISEEQHKTARFWADRACDFMAESRVRIVWEVDDLKTAGCFRRSTPDTIFLNPTLTVEAIAPTVLHECAHRKRFLRGLPNTEQLVELDELELCSLLGAS